jgi:hypothetical protein
VRSFVQTRTVMSVATKVMIERTKGNIGFVVPPARFAL